MIEGILNYLNLLNTNKIFWGVTMIMVNIGSRYVLGDLGKFHEYILTQNIVKKIITFCLFFVATRDVITSFALTLIYIVVIDGMLHEKRNFCILPKKFKERFTTTVTEDEYKKALNIVELYQKNNAGKKQKDIYDLYKESKQNI